MGNVFSTLSEFFSTWLKDTMSVSLLVDEDICSWQASRLFTFTFCTRKWVVVFRNSLYSYSCELTYHCAALQTSIRILLGNTKQSANVRLFLLASCLLVAGRRVGFCMWCRFPYMCVFRCVCLYVCEYRETLDQWI